MAKKTYDEDHVKWLKYELIAEQKDLVWIRKLISRLIFRQPNEASSLHKALRLTKENIRRIDDKINFRDS